MVLEPAGHAEMDDPHHAGVEIEDEVLSTAGEALDAAAGELAAEVIGGEELDEAGGVLGDPGAGDGAASNQRLEVAADGFDFGKFGHGTS
jgi:hypothetical protein